jgi:hypothetical protein
MLPHARALDLPALHSEQDRQRAIVSAQCTRQTPEQRRHREPVRETMDKLQYSATDGEPKRYEKILIPVGENWSLLAR